MKRMRPPGQLAQCMARALLLALAWLPAGLQADVAAGRALFQTGLWFGEEVFAEVGQGVSLPGSLLPCSSCHGSDALGRPEGGVVPSDLRWQVLIQTHTREVGSGRIIRGYDADSFAIAITQGIDAGGNTLDPSMPRYKFSPQQIAALIAYLKTVDTDGSSGVQQKAVRIGTLIGADTPSIHTTILQALVDRLNTQGGVHGRSLELAVVQVPAEPSALATVLQRADVLLWLAADPGAAETQFNRLVEQQQLINVAPLPRGYRQARNYSTFLLVPDATEVLGTCLRQSIRSYAKSDLSGMYALTNIGDAFPMTNDRVLAAWAQYVSQPVRAITVETGVALPQDYSHGVYASAVALEGSGPQLGQGQSLCALGHQQAANLTRGEPAYEAWLAFPWPLQFVGQPSKVEAYRAFAQGLSLPPQYPRLALMYAGFELALHGLKTVGRRIDADRVIEALEQSGQIETGALPPLSYGPGIRVGFRQVFLVSNRSGAWRPEGLFPSGIR